MASDLLFHRNLGQVDLAITAALITTGFARYPIMTSDRTSEDYLPLEAGDSAEFLQVEADGVLRATAMIGSAIQHVDLPGVEDAFYFGLASTEMGSGLGSRLLAETMRIAAARGFRRVLLSTLVEFGLPPYYERYGFRVIGHEDYEAGHWDITVSHRLVYMERVVPYLLRPLSADEIEAATAMINAAYRVEDFFINGNRTNAAAVGEDFAAGRMFALEASGEIAGVVSLDLSQPGRGYFGPLAVDPARSRGGHGRAIVSAVEQLATDAGCTAMDLTVVNIREELAPWYRRQGYRECGTQPFPEPEKLKRPAHMVAMSKPLVARGEGRPV